METKPINCNFPNYPENKLVSSVEPERIVPTERTPLKSWQIRLRKKAMAKETKQRYYTNFKKLHAKS